jgi:anti-anti-sigma factor
MAIAMNAKKTVLVIDDETATLTMFRLFLNAYGYTVLTAENGEIGLDLVRQHQPEIVFTDLKMPGMDGFAVLKQIKKEAPATEVIVITGHGDMDHVIQALNLNATDFINKPIGRSALDAALKRVEARLRDGRRHGIPVQVEVEDDVATLTIRETLCGRHKAQLMESMARARAAGAEGMVLNFYDHSAVNGAGIALLTRLLTEAKSTGTRFCITGLSENFKTIFDMVGITRIAPVVETLEAAMTAMGKDATP